MRAVVLLAASLIALPAWAQPSAPAVEYSATAVAPPGVGASYLDHAIVSVHPVENGLVEIVIEDRGRAKAPAPIRITRVGQQKPTDCGVPLEVFRHGTRVARFRAPASPAIVRVELDPDHQYPDADRANDVWVRR